MCCLRAPTVIPPVFRGVRHFYLAFECFMFYDTIASLDKITIFNRRMPFIGIIIIFVEIILEAFIILLAGIIINVHLALAAPGINN